MVTGVVPVLVRVAAVATVVAAVVATEAVDDRHGSGHAEWREF